MGKYDLSCCVWLPQMPVYHPESKLASLLDRADQRVPSAVGLHGAPYREQRMAKKHPKMERAQNGRLCKPSTECQKPRKRNEGPAFFKGSLLAHLLDWLVFGRCLVSGHREEKALSALCTALCSADEEPRIGQADDCTESTPSRDLMIYFRTFQPKVLLLDVIDCYW